MIFEKYNEITFFEPTESFHAILERNQYHKYRERCANQALTEQQQQLQANGGFDQTAAANAVAALNIGKYQNYLSVN